MADDGGQAVKYGHHKYTWSKPFGSTRHQWELVGPFGGLQFHVSFYDNKPSAGLEIHYNRLSAHDAMTRAPYHVTCWLTKEPCWHDGTTLYAEETLWPMIEPMLRSGAHDRIFNFLEEEANQRFADALLSALAKEPRNG